MILEYFECRTALTCQMFRYEWRPYHGAIELIFLHKIYLGVSFPMPPAEVNPMVRSEVMHVLLKSDQSISRERERAVEEMKERGSMVHPWC